MLKCSCGSTDFKPLGIQEGWSNRKGSASPRMLFLVNCRHCGTTLSCNRLDYALLRGREVLEAVDHSFYALEGSRNL